MSEITSWLLKNRRAAIKKVAFATEDEFAIAEATIEELVRDIEAGFDAAESMSWMEIEDEIMAACDALHEGA